MRYRLDPALAERAGLTARQVQALELWGADRRTKGGGYDSVARALDISKSSARERIRSALRKIEKAERGQVAA